MSAKDLIGKTFNRLTIINVEPNDKTGKARIRCKCSCGQEKIIDAYSVKKGIVKSCGCYHKERIHLQGKDFTGKRFGSLVAIERLPKYKQNKTYYKCRCDCGKEIIVNGGQLSSKNTKSCGCSQKKYINVNFEGMCFGRLTVIEDNLKSKVKCLCSCGKETYVLKSNLIKGNTQSCGCLHKEIAKANFSTHNLSKTRLYRIYLKMKERCYNPKNKAYKNYGGRGISICKEWLNDFEKFYNWANTNGYTPALSIERKNVNGNYEPQNCTWIRKSDQSKNRRNCVFIEFNGKRMTLADWAKETGYNAQTLRNRFNKYGQDEVEKVIIYKRRM